MKNNNHQNHHAAPEPEPSTPTLNPNHQSATGLVSPTNRKCPDRSSTNYLGKCSAIAGRIVEAGMYLNLEILPNTPAMQDDILPEAYNWREPFLFHLSR